MDIWIGNCRPGYTLQLSSRQNLIHFSNDSIKLQGSTFLPDDEANNHVVTKMQSCSEVYQDSVLHNL